MYLLASALFKCCTNSKTFLVGSREKNVLKECEQHIYLKQLANEIQATLRKHHKVS